MKLYIKEDKGHELKLWLPTSLLKSKFIIRNIKRYGSTDIEPFMDLLPMLYKVLKKYIKQNGHFVLLDIKSSDGDEVIIKV